MTPCARSLRTLLVAFTGALAACHTVRPPDQAFSGYPVRPPIGLQVGLHLSPELCHAEWRRKVIPVVGDTWIIPIGPSLCENSEVLARRTFSKVVRVDHPTSAAIPGVDAILMPRLAYIDRTFGATSMGESITTIKLLWTLTSADGRLIWTDTVSGEARGESGFGDHRAVLRAALEQVLQRSQEAMFLSPAIRDYTIGRPQ